MNTDEPKRPSSVVRLSPHAYIALRAHAEKHALNMRVWLDRVVLAEIAKAESAAS